MHHILPPSHSPSPSLSPPPPSPPPYSITHQHTISHPFSLPSPFQPLILTPFPIHHLSLYPLSHAFKSFPSPFPSSRLPHLDIHTHSLLIHNTFTPLTCNQHLSLRRLSDESLQPTFTYTLSSTLSGDFLYLEFPASETSLPNQW